MSDDETTQLKFEFSNPEAARHFLSWLCESGEQEHWDWMSVREQEEDGPITAVQIDYWQNDNKKFGEGTIIAECGRLDHADV